MEMFEGVSAAIWVLWLVSIAIAALLGGAGVGIWLSARFYRRQVEKVSAEARIAAARRRVDAPGYGRAVDPEPTVRIPDGYRNAGSELHWHEDAVLAETSPMPVLQEEPLLPAVSPRPEDLRAGGDDGDPPDGGGPGPTATAIQPRYDWAHIRGARLPLAEPWRERAKPLFDAVARFRRQRPDVRLLWSALALLPPLRHWLFRMLATSYRTGRHAACRGVASWDDKRAVLSARWYRECQEASTATQELILRARRTQATMAAPPWRRCA